MQYLDYLDMVNAFFKIIGLCFLILFLSFFFFYQSDSVCFENKCISVEVVSSHEDIMRGLKFRDTLNEGTGMLFLFEEPREIKFWMKDVNFPIDIIFINENYEIISIYSSVPPCFDIGCPLYPSNGEMLYVVETVANFTIENNINIGDKVKIS